MSMRPIVILGPTGGGKSELAVALAERLDRGNGQIISADSMQVCQQVRSEPAGKAHSSEEGPACTLTIPAEMV